MNNEKSSGFIGAIQHLQYRAEKSLEAEGLRKARGELRKLDLDDLSSVEERAKNYLAIAQARFSAGEISEDDFAFYRRYALEHLVHESRWLNGNYEDVLGPISESIAQLQSEYGLTKDEYYPRGEGPPKYIELNAEYERQLDKKLIEVFREFGADDLAEIFLSNKENFYAHSELGRKSIFIDNEVDRLNELAIGYEREAKLSQEGEAYLSASIMLCAAIETRLLIKCISNEQQARKAAIELGLTNKVLKSKKPQAWKLETLIEVSAQAGWIHNVETERFIFRGKDIAHLLREVRNRVHPHVQLKKNLGLSFGREQYKDVEAAHIIIQGFLDMDKS